MSSFFEIIRSFMLALGGTIFLLWLLVFLLGSVWMLLVAINELQDALGVHWIQLSLTKRK